MPRAVPACVFLNTIMIETTCNLDLSRLEKVRHTGGKVTARCPACAEHGGDRKGNHLTIFPSGKFACAAVSGDAEHRRRIFALVGIVSNQVRDDGEIRRWREQRAKEQALAKERERLSVLIRQKRERIIARYEWDVVSLWDDSPQRIDCDLVEYDPRHFLASLFPHESLVWTGGTTHSGSRHADRWRRVKEWQKAALAEIGPMTTPTMWRPNTTNRTAQNVSECPYVVLDFDGFDGLKPKNPDEIEKNRQDSLALVRWIRETLKWQLAAILWTGSKSIHAWFHTPPREVLLSLRNTAPALGIDAGLVCHPEHPCRLPGQRHEKSGGMSRVLWLQTAV